jgi:hypothetical protein
VDPLMDTSLTAAKPPPLELPRELLWLLDAPLFIDGKQVEAFYDAVLRPDYEGTSTTLSDSITQEVKLGGKTTVGLALPWFAKAEATASIEGSKGGERGREATFSPISNAYRHLLALALHYASQPEHNRLVIAHPAEGQIVGVNGADLIEQWLTQEFIEDAPRALVLLDMPRGVKFIPAALELDNGEVRVLVDSLGKALGGEGAPKYPGSLAPEVEKDEYFKWFVDHFNDRTALSAVESAVTDHRVAWIAYNFSLDGKGGPFMHLHLAGRGEYDTGVFAYNFLTRGLNYGLRIVGTLKSGPDLNVLAIFEC